VHQERGRFSDAETAAKRCIELEPTWPRGYARLAKALESQRRYASAAEIVGRLVEREPTEHATVWLVQLQALAREDAAAQEARMLAALAQARAVARARIPQVPYVAQAFTARFGDRFRRSAHIFDFVATLPEQERLETILWMRSKGRYMAAGETVFGALVVATGFAYTSGGIMTGLRDILPTERYDAIVAGYHAREAELPPTKLEISVVDGQATFDESTYWLGIADGNKELATWYQAQRWGEEDLKAARWRG